MRRHPLRAIHLSLAVAGVLGAQAGHLRAQARPAPSRGPDWAAFDAYVRKGMRDWDVPGLSLAIVHGDSTLVVRGYGVRRLGAPGAVDTETLFGMMSTTKAFTAMALGMLVDDGVLHWDDPVTRWLPTFALQDPTTTRGLRVVDLLTHNTGLPNADLLWARQDMGAAEILHRVRGIAAEYPLRGGFTYQNVMYGAAGEVVARASRMPWAAFLRQRIFLPAGMLHTYATYGQMVASGDTNRSVPHFRIRDTLRVIEEDIVDSLPSAGALWSTADDAATWLRFLLDSTRVGGRRLVSDSTFRRLFQPQAFVSEQEFYPTAQRTHPHWTTYGLGWFQQDYRGEMVQMHTGSLAGRTAIIGLIPERRIGVYLFGNADHAELRHALMWRVFDLLLGAPERDWSRELLDLYGAARARADSARAEADTKRIPGTAPTLPLERYAGRYGHPVWGDLHITLADGQLRLRMGVNPQLAGPLTHWHYDTFRALLGDGRDPPSEVTFVLGSSGEPVEARWLGEVWERR